MSNTPLKVVVVGSNGSGKSSIVSRLISGKFDPDIKPTVYKIRYRKCSKVKNELIDLEIIDTSGKQQQYEAIQDETFITGDIFVIVYSINNLQSFKYANNVRNQISILRENNPFPLLLIGNKCDLNDSIEITTDKGQQLAKEWKCSFLETSAKNNSNIQKLFECIVTEYKQFNNNNNNIPSPIIASFDDKLQFKLNWISSFCKKKTNSSLIHQTEIDSYPVVGDTNIDDTHKPILVLKTFKIRRRFICKRFIMAILCGIFLPFVIIIQTLMFITYSDIGDQWIINKMMQIIEWGIVKNGTIIAYERMHHSLLLDVLSVIIGRNPNQDPEAQKNRKWFLKQTKIQKLKRIGLTILASIMYAVCCFNLSQIKANCLQISLESVVPFILLWTFWIIFSFWIAYEPQLDPELPPITQLQSILLYFGEEFKDATSVYSFLRSYIWCRYSALKPSILPTIIIIGLSVLYAFVPSMTRWHTYFTNVRMEDAYFMDITAKEQSVRVGAFMVNTFLLSIFMYSMDLQYRRYLTNYKEWMNDLTLLLDKQYSSAHFISFQHKSNALSWLEIRSYLLVEARLFWCEQELPIALTLIISILLTVYLSYNTFFIEGDPMQSMAFNSGCALLMILLAGLIRICMTGYQLSILQQKQQQLINEQVMNKNDNDRNGYLETVINFVNKNDIIPRLFNVGMNSIISKVIGHIVICSFIISLKLLPLWYPIVIVSIGILALCIPYIMTKIKTYCSVLEIIWENNNNECASYSTSSRSNSTDNSDEPIPTTTNDVIISTGFIQDVASPKLSFIIDNKDKDKDKNKNKWKSLSIPYWKGKRLIICRRPTVTFNYNIKEFEIAFGDKEIDGIDEGKYSKYDDEEIDLQITNTTKYKPPIMPRRYTVDPVELKHLHEKFEKNNQNKKQKQQQFEITDVDDDDDDDIDDGDDNEEEFKRQIVEFQAYYDQTLGTISTDNRLPGPIPIQPTMSVTPFEYISPKMWSINEEVESPTNLPHQTSINLIEHKQSATSDEKEYESSQRTVSTPNNSRTSTSRIRNGSLLKEIIRNENEDDSSQQTLGSSIPPFIASSTPTVSLDTDYDTDFDPNDSVLLKEIRYNENEWRKYIRKCPDYDDDDDYQNNNDDEKENENEKNNKQRKPNRNNRNNDRKNNNDNNDDNDDGDDGKKNNDNNNDKEEEYDDTEILQRLRELQNHRKYKIMIKKNKKLKSEELIALIYYTDSSSCCNKMKEVHRKKSKNDRFKSLYFHATNAIKKIYKVFHFQNTNQKHYRNKHNQSMLFHGSIIDKLDVLSKDQLFLKTMTSFTTDFGVAKSFATGMLLVIENVWDALYCGNLKGGDVGWISKFQEYEYIILPTLFNNWREMEKEEMMNKYRWIISSDINVYITNEYKSNKNPLCPYPDGIHPNIDIKYDEYKQIEPILKTQITETPSSINNINDICSINGDDNKYKDIWNWFINEVKLNNDDNKKYFNLFISVGYDTMDGIKEIEMDDLEQVGITKYGHKKKIINAIKRLI